MQAVNTTALAIELGLAAATFLCSVGASMFIAGTRWGQVNSEMRAMNDRLAKIEGMFTLRPKDMQDGN